MPKEQGYIDPLLSNLAVDWSKRVRDGLIGPILFPRVMVGKPSGRYAIFDAETAYKVPDTTMSGDRAKANEFAASATMANYVTTPHGLKEFIDKENVEFMEGPFKLWEKRYVETLTSKLELSQEKRIADVVYGLPGRSTALSGTGTGATNKWSSASDTAGGDPHAAIRDAISHLFYRPNLMILTESVFDTLEFHPRLLKVLGEANMIKKVDETTLAKLFRIDRVIIAKGKADFGKRNAEKTVNPLAIWGNGVVLAHTNDIWDEPCAGKTVSLKYTEADGQGWVVRKWDEADGGVLGGEYVQVAHRTAELVVAKELIYSIKDVL